MLRASTSRSINGFSAAAAAAARGGSRRTLKTTTSSVIRRTALGFTGLTVGGGGLALTTYAYTTEEGLGLRREYRFWRKVFPVVFDYYWQTSRSSPYVRYKKWKANDNDDEEKTEEESKLEKQQRRELLEKLHKRHAVDIFEIMLELKGLYIKLGQVLSVTSLPIPEAYREKFRTLQSNVPGWENFDEVVKPIIEAELGKPIDEVFAYVDPKPCGAASIGQAHRAVLLLSSNKSTSSTGNDDGEDGEKEVVIKVQYPDASWQVPADIQCVGDLLKICVWAGVVDESAANMSFNEFASQFVAELDYDRERRNLQRVYNSATLDPRSPYKRRGVLVPKVYDDLCTSRIITMKYLPGPKLEEEAKKQLQMLGIDTTRNLRKIVRDVAQEVDDNRQSYDGDNSNDNATAIPTTSRQQTKDQNQNQTKQDKFDTNIATKMSYWKMDVVSKLLEKVVGVDNILSAVRLFRRIVLWSTAIAVGGIQAVSSSGVVSVPQQWDTWAEEHKTVAKQAERLSLTADWIDALFDVHGHQIFQLGLFNADPHPGNILVIDRDEENQKENGSTVDQEQDRPLRMRRNMLGLIDYGQCKELDHHEQVQIARLMLSVANDINDKKHDDEVIANHFRALGIKTKNNSTEFLADFARLMFGPLQPKHLSHTWHKNFHEMDRVLYFPKELSMVYRTALLLRGLAISLQLNVSVCDKWKQHAEATLEHEQHQIIQEKDQSQEQKFHIGQRQQGPPIIVRRPTVLAQVRS